MILSLEWLSEFVETGADVKAYCDRMTATGSKVEGWETLGDALSNVRVGKILTIEKHPDADKLLVTSVDVGEDAPRQIVTAAHNIEVGMMVPVACAPATLPKGVKIKKGKLRGVESDGMFCSIAELELTVHDMPGAPEDGILPITEDCRPGDDVCDVLKLRDTAVEFEITPNRPDCLSVIGLARETAASFEKKAVWHAPVVTEAGGDVADYLSVTDSAPDLCMRYSARVVRNVKIAPSPMWMRRRLRSCGVRPINNIVDITNYVMLEYGQPMHAFDYTCLDGSRINVRRAAQGEQFKSLDDADHVLRDDMLVIADEKKAVALAGIMGGANSEITDATATVVFESACFNGPSVRITSRALGMRTESSGRFEKQLDPENTMPALDRACELVTMLGAGEVVSGCIDVYPGKWQQTVLPLEADRINATLGVDLTADYMADVLRSLEIPVRDGKVYVPSWRSDIACMNDLAEEVLRIWGYDTIAPTLFSAQVKTGRFTPRREYRHRMADLLCSLGMDEIITFSFISPKWYDKIGMAQDDPLRKSVVIRNPLGEDTSVMRTTLLPSLVDCLVRNGSTHGGKASLYEIASVYRPLADPDVLPDEHMECALGFVGDGDFYALKGIVEEVLADAGITDAKYLPVKDDPSYHPGRCAKVVAADGTVLGILGQLHPTMMEGWGMDAPVYAAVLEFENILAMAKFEHSYRQLPKYPASTRDFALVCSEDVTWGDLSDCVAKAGGSVVESVELFDVYRGVQLGADNKSMAFTVTLRAPDRTLTDEEADAAVQKMLAAAETQLGAVLRK